MLKIESHFNQALIANGLPANVLGLVTNKDGSVSVSVVVRNYPDDGTSKKNLLCRIYDDSIILQRSILGDDSLPECFSVATSATAQRKVLFLPNVSDDALTALCDRIVAGFLREYSPASFGCCSQYVACSNARQCLHTDLLYSKGCMYRANLETGRIFYGSGS